MRCLEFDFDNWLESVDGKKVYLMTPQGLGPSPQGFQPKDEVFCGECEEMRMLVSTDLEEKIGHCPVCGRMPGALELGTKSADEWDFHSDNVDSI